MLPPGFKYRDSDRIGEIERPVIRHHGDADPVLFETVILLQFKRQASAFTSENKPGAGSEFHLWQRPRGVGGKHIEIPGIRMLFFDEVIPAFIGLQRGVFPIIETGAAQMAVVEREAKRLDQMQCAAGIG